jgi:hypothetical protein
MSTETFPARLHALFAQDTLDALVIRRGPSKRTAVIGWDRKTDVFTLGQWLNGRIYERRSDLSPDGKHFIYFAMNGKWNRMGSWTAISKTPYLCALTLFAKGDCWNGGGLFQSKDSYWLNDLNDGYGHTQQFDQSKLTRRLTRPSSESYGGECPGVYYLRLQRDGWTLIQNPNTTKLGELQIFEKPLHAGWILRKFAHATTDHPVGKGCYFDTHSLMQTKSHTLLECPDWEWAELDRNRIVYAEHGKLYAAELNQHGLSTPKLLFDFNAMRYKRIKAPYDQGVRRVKA